MPRILAQTIDVRPEHIDENGHVNNVVYVQWMQDVAYAHSVAQGFDATAMQRLGHTWVIRSHFIQYLRPALVGDAIRAYTWVANLRRASSLRRYKFLRPSDGAVIATGETDWVYVLRETGRPIPIIPEVRAAFPAVAGEEAP